MHIVTGILLAVFVGTKISFPNTTAVHEVDSFHQTERTPPEQCLATWSWTKETGPQSLVAFWEDVRHHVEPCQGLLFPHGWMFTVNAQILPLRWHFRHWHSKAFHKHFTVKCIVHRSKLAHHFDPSQVILQMKCLGVARSLPPPWWITNKAKWGMGQTWDLFPFGPTQVGNRMSSGIATPAHVTTNACHFRWCVSFKDCFNTAGQPSHAGWCKDPL